jgi:hypothetical protein
MTSQKHLTFFNFSHPSASNKYLLNRKPLFLLFLPCVIVISNAVPWRLITLFCRECQMTSFLISIPCRFVGYLEVLSAAASLNTSLIFPLFHRVINIQMCHSTMLQVSHCLTIKIGSQLFSILWCSLSLEHSFWSRLSIVITQRRIRTNQEQMSVDSYIGF